MIGRPNSAEHSKAKTVTKHDNYWHEKRKEKRVDGIFSFRGLDKPGYWQDKTGEERNVVQSLLSRALPGQHRQGLPA